VVPGVHQPQQTSSRIGKLNNYTPALRKHRGSISLDSDLDSIEEEADSSKRKSGFSQIDSQLEGNQKKSGSSG
jgi:hypothetical protein